jgi:CRP/FNR family transcriptional regulator, dissimilatory nitrate respiration regulator
MPAVPGIAGLAALPAQSGAERARCTTYGGQLISQLPLFQGVAPAELDGVCGDASVLRVPAGATVFVAGEPADGLYVVVLGRVRLNLGSGANSRVIAVMERGDCIGLAVLLQRGTYPVTATAAEDSLLVRVPATTVQRVMAEVPALASRLIGDMASKLAGFVKDIGGYTQRSARARVASLLLDMRRDTPQDVAEVAFREPKRLVASRLAMTPETLSRELGGLAAEGAIESHRNRFRLLDRAALERAVVEGPRSQEPR